MFPACIDHSLPLRERKKLGIFLWSRLASGQIKISRLFQNDFRLSEISESRKQATSVQTIRVEVLIVFPFDSGKSAARKKQRASALNKSKMWLLISSAPRLMTFLGPP